MFDGSTEEWSTWLTSSLGVTELISFWVQCSPNQTRFSAVEDSHGTTLFQCSALTSGAFHKLLKALAVDPHRTAHAGGLDFPTAHQPPQRHPAQAAILLCIWVAEPLSLYCLIHRLCLSVSFHCFP